MEKGTPYLQKIAEEIVNHGNESGYCKRTPLWKTRFYVHSKGIKKRSVCHLPQKGIIPYRKWKSSSKITFNTSCYNSLIISSIYIFESSTEIVCTASNFSRNKRLQHSFPGAVCLCRWVSGRCRWGWSPHCQKGVHDERQYLQVLYEKSR